MSQIPYLEDFAAGGGSSNVKPSAAVTGVDELRASFDEGYKCGWQDGVAANDNDESEVRNALSSALQALNFTYFEARQHAMQSVRPVLEAMVEAVLPQLLAESLGGRVVEALDAVAQTIEAPVVISCAPETEDMLRGLVSEVVTFPVTIEAEPTLTASQATLKLNDGQMSVDLDATLIALRQCINTFFEEPEKKEMSHV